MFESMVRDGWSIVFLFGVSGKGFFLLLSFDGCYYFFSQSLLSGREQVFISSYLLSILDYFFFFFDRK